MRSRKSILLPAIGYITVMLLLLIAIILVQDRSGGAVVLLSAIAILHVILGAIYFVIWIYLSLDRIKHHVQRLNSGILGRQEPGRSPGELHELSVRLNKHQERLQEAVRQLSELTHGNVPADFNTLGERDELGNAIVRLREQIERTSSEARRRQLSDEQQNWTSQGIARFGALLRDHQEEGDVFSLFIRELVRYVDAEVGGVYLTQADDAIVLRAAYAFDREKLVTREFAPGEGLVGRCVMEQAPIHITEVPPEYIKIRSGLGEMQPAMLFLVPVWFDNRVIGVIEMASFEPLEKHQLAFLEELGKNIGSSMTRIQSSTQAK